jgi:segregation and condensation protein B
VSRRRKKQPEAIPEEILAEGSGPHDADDLADAAAEILARASIDEVEAEVEAVEVAAAAAVAEAHMHELDDAELRNDPQDVELRSDTSDVRGDAPGKARPGGRLLGDNAGRALPESADESRRESDKVAGESDKVAGESDKVAGESDKVAGECDKAAGEADEVGGERDKAASEADEVASASDKVDGEADMMAEPDRVAVDSADAELDAIEPTAAQDAAVEAADRSEADVEDAVMRAEAEAELGNAEEPEPAEDGELGASLPTTAGSMDDRQLKNLVEALVFAADKPVTLQRLRQLTRVSDVRRLEQVLADLAADYANRGIALQQVSGGYLFRTNTHYSTWVQQLIAGRPVRLSRAQLETLAIIAYRQPITRPEVDEIRGVDSSATLRLLMDRSLIRILGKKEEVGRPMLYGTTKEFLDFFSLSDLRELPTLREYSELTAESRKVMSDELGMSLDATPSAEGHEEANEVDPSVAVSAGDDGPSSAGESDATGADHIETSAAVEAEMSKTVDATSFDIDATDELSAAQVDANAPEQSATGDDVADGITADAAETTSSFTAVHVDVPLSAPQGGSTEDPVDGAEQLDTDSDEALPPDAHDVSATSALDEADEPPAD